MLRWSGVMALVLTCVLLMSAAAGAAEKQVVSIAFWGGDNDVEINSRLKAEFEAQNPGVEVELLHIPGGYDDKLKTMIAGGVAPDVMMMAEGFATYVADDLLLPLDELIASDAELELDDYFPRVVEAYRYQGNLYVLPARWSPLILYYHTYLFDEAGVSYPNESWDWDAFLKAAKKLTRGELPNKKWGIGSIGGWWPWWMTPIYQNGGRVLNEERTKTVMDSPEAIEALEWYQSLLHEHHINPVGDEWQHYPGKGPDQLFESGITAMNQTGFWAVYWLRQKDVEWDVALLPKQNKRATMLFSNGWAISKDSENPQLAWKLVKFMTDIKAQELTAQSGHDVPVRLSVASSDAFLDPSLPPAHAELILEAAGHIVPPPVTDKWGEMLGLMGAEINRLLAGEISATEAVANFKDAVNALLAQ